MMHPAKARKGMIATLTAALVFLTFFYIFSTVRFLQVKPGKAETIENSSTRMALTDAIISPHDKGKWLFSHYGCATCHGVGGKGGVTDFLGEEGDLLPDLQSIAETQDIEGIIDALDEGSILEEGPPVIYSMPRFKNILKHDEKLAVAGYLMSLTPPEEDTDE